MMPAAPSALDYVDEIVAEMGARRLVVFLDYDGTLTPIVSRPEKAVLSNSTRQTLQKLAAQAPVTILSGRDLEDIRHRVGIGGIVYAGSHGFDIAGPRGLRKQIATDFLSILEAARTELKEKLAGIPGALVERKRFSIAAHYRQANENAAAKVQRAVNKVAAQHPQLRLLVGKKVYELQPDIDWNKGKALLWLLEMISSEPREIFPIYVGDDLTDEDAFRVIKQCGLGIVVSEEPRPTAARYALKTPAEVDRFLHKIVARLPTNAAS